MGLWALEERWFYGWKMKSWSIREERSVEGQGIKGCSMDSGQKVCLLDLDERWFSWWWMKDGLSGRGEKQVFGQKIKGSV